MERAMGIVCLICGLGLSACGDRPVLRDYYMGKSLLQPDKVQRPQPRDANGNAIIPSADAMAAGPQSEAQE
jgi:hypothetical protein